MAPERALGRRMMAMTLYWPRWIKMLVWKSQFNVIEELRSLEIEFEQGKRPGKHHVKRLSKVHNKFQGVSFTGGLAICCGVIIILKEMLHDSIVNRLFGCMMVAGAVSLLMGFLVGIVGIDGLRRRQDSLEEDASSVVGKSHALVADMFVLALFLTSTIPFTLPWALAYFFPYELMVVALVTYGINALIGRVLRTCTPHSKYSSRPASVQSMDEEEEESKNIGMSPEKKNALIEYLSSTSGKLWVSAFLVLESILVLISGAVSVAWEKYLQGIDFQSDFNDRWLELFAVFFAGMVSICLFLQAFWIVYASAGQMLYPTVWKFYQPFIGGNKFVVLQFLSWSLYAVSLSLACERLRPVITLSLSTVVEPVRVEQADQVIFAFGWLSRLLCLDQLLPAGGVAILHVAGFAFMIISLFEYHPPNQAEFVEEETDRLKLLLAMDEEHQVVAEPKEEESFLYVGLRTALLSFILFCTVKPELVIGLFSWTLCSTLPADFPILSLMGTVLALYGTTYIGNPSLTGVRKVSNDAACLFGAVQKHFKLISVRCKGLWDEDENAEYVFAYHAHGLFPPGCAYFANCSHFSKLFPKNVNPPRTLSATITHQFPILRDMNQLTGAMEVTKRGLWAGLDNNRSILLCPGGQHEMLLAIKDDPRFEMTSTRHKGFVRIALRRAAINPERNVYLTPIFAFGERLTLSNAPFIPFWIQEWSVKYFRSNIAFIPVHGDLQIPCVPSRGNGTTIVVGTPIKVPTFSGESTNPTNAQVDLLHRRYYSAVKELFDTYKHHHPDFENRTMVMSPPLKTLTEKEFAKAWESVANESAPFDVEEQKQFERDTDVNIFVRPWQEQFVVAVVFLIFGLGPYVILRCSV